MCLALGFPRCAFNRLTEQVMGTRGDLAGSLQPGGLVMWAADREVPIRTSAGLVTAWMGSSSGDWVENSPVWSRSIPLRGLEPTSLGPWYPVSLRLVAALFCGVEVSMRLLIFTVNEYSHIFL